MSEHLDAVIEEVAGKIAELQNFLGALHEFRATKQNGNAAAPTPVKVREIVPRRTVGRGGARKVKGPKQPRTKAEAPGNGEMTVADAMRTVFRVKAKTEWKAASLATAIGEEWPHLKDRQRTISVTLCNLSAAGEIVKVSPGVYKALAARDGKGVATPVKEKTHISPPARLPIAAQRGEGSSEGGAVDGGERGAMIELVREALKEFEVGKTFTRADVVEALTDKVVPWLPSTEGLIGMQLWKLTDQGVLTKKGFGTMAEFTRVK